MKLSQQISISIFSLASAALLTSAWLPDLAAIDKYDSALAPTFTSGPPSSRSGAPGESNCTSCHAGSVMDGSTENIFDVRSQGMSVTSYLPGETYTVHLSMNSQPARKGFQATVLNGSNNFVGNFAAVSANGVQTQSGMGRTYVAHNTTGTGSGISEWMWEWTAPASDEGPVTFYVATNKANNNGGSGGDEIFTSSHNLGATVGLDEAPNTLREFELGYAPETHKAFVTFNSQISGASSVNVVDMNGRSVHTAFLGATNQGENKFQVNLPAELSNGQYVLHFFVNNRASSGLINVVR